MSKPREPNPETYLHGKHAEQFKDAKVGQKVTMVVQATVSSVGRGQSRDYMTGKPGPVRHNASLEIKSMVPQAQKSRLSTTAPTPKPPKPPTKPATAKKPAPEVKKSAPVAKKRGK